MDNLSRTVSKLRDERDELRVSLLSVTQHNLRAAASEKASAKAVARKDVALAEAQQQIAELKAALFLYTSGSYELGARDAEKSTHSIYPVSPPAGQRDGRLYIPQVAPTSTNFSDHIVAELRKENVALLDMVQQQQNLVSQLNQQCAEFRDKSRSAVDLWRAAQLKSLALLLVVVLSKYETRRKKNAFDRILRHCLREKQYVSDLRLRSQLSERTQHAEHVQHVKTATAMALLRLRSHGQMVFVAWKSLMLEQRYSSNIAGMLELRNRKRFGRQCLQAWQEVVHRRHAQKDQLRKVFDHQLRRHLTTWRSQTGLELCAKLARSTSICRCLEETVATQQQLIEELGFKDAKRAAVWRWRMLTKTQLSLKRLNTVLFSQVDARLMRRSFNILRTHASRQKALRTATIHWCHFKLRGAFSHWKSTTAALTRQTDKRRECIRHCIVANKLSYISLQHAFLQWRANCALRTQKMQQLARVIRQCTQRHKVQAFHTWHITTVASVSRLNALACMVNRMLRAKLDDYKRLAFTRWVDMKQQVAAMRLATALIKTSSRKRRLLAGVRQLVNASRRTRAVHISMGRVRLRLCTAAWHAWKTSFISSRSRSDQTGFTWVAIRHASRINFQLRHEAWQAWRTAHQAKTAQIRALLALTRVHCLLAKRRSFALWSCVSQRSQKLQRALRRTFVALANSIKRTTVCNWRVRALHAGAAAREHRVAELHLMASMFQSWRMKLMQKTHNAQINSLLATGAAKEAARRLIQRTFAAFRSTIQIKRNKQLLRVLQATFADSWLKRRTRSLLQQWVTQVAGQRSSMALRRTASAALRAWCALHAARTKSVQCNRALADSALQHWRTNALAAGVEERLVHAFHGLSDLAGSVIASNRLDVLVRCSERAFAFCLPQSACKVWIAEPNQDYMWSLSPDLRGGPAKVTTPLEARSLCGVTLLCEDEAYSVDRTTWVPHIQSVGQISMLCFPSADVNPLFDPAVDIAVDHVRCSAKTNVSVRADVFVLQPTSESRFTHTSLSGRKDTLRIIVQLAACTGRGYSRVEAGMLVWISAQISTGLDLILAANTQRDKHHRASNALLSAKSEIRDVRTQVFVLRRFIVYSNFGQRDGCR
jgi:hypothetical protein